MAIAKMLENLPWICQNYKNGCHEIKTDAVELKNHQKQCDFRQVFCLDVDCSSENKVIFKDFTDHLVAVHDINSEIEMSEDEDNKWFTYHNIFDSPPKVYERKRKKYIPSFVFQQSMIGQPRKIINTEGDVFYAALYESNNVFYFVIFLNGSSNEAKRYSVKCSVENKDREVSTFTGKVHNLDEKVDDIFESETCFRIGNRFVMRSLEIKRIENRHPGYIDPPFRRLLSLLEETSRGRPRIDEKKQLCIEISIKNLEDLEFDISDGE